MIFFFFPQVHCLSFPLSSWFLDRCKAVSLIPPRGRGQPSCLERAELCNTRAYGGFSLEGELQDAVFFPSVAKGGLALAPFLPTGTAFHGDYVFPQHLAQGHHESQLGPQKIQTLQILMQNRVLNSWKDPVTLRCCNCGGAGLHIATQDS